MSDGKAGGNANQKSLVQLETLNLLRGLIKIKYPAFLSNLDIRMNVPFFNEFTVSIPKVIFKALFYFGLVTSVCYLYRYIRRGY
jgi:hypothetical protein